MPLYMNSVNIGGYLVSKPDGTPTRDGLPRVKFVVALNHPKKTTPEYIRCVAWGERAIAITKYASKGQEILVTGELETSTWKDRHRTQHTTTEIVVSKFNLGNKPRSKPDEAVLVSPRPYLDSNEAE